MKFLRLFFIAFVLTSLKIAGQDTKAIQDSIAIKLLLAENKKTQTNYDEAIKIYNEIIELASEHNFEKSEATSLTEIANVFYKTKENEKALEMLMQATQIQRRIDDKVGLSWSYNTYGLIYASTGDYKNSLDYYDIAQTNFENLEDNSALSIVLLNKGLLFFKQNDFLYANQLFDEALALAERNKSFYNSASILIEKAKVQIELNNQDAAFNTIQSSLRIAKEHELPILEIEAKKVLSDVYQKMGNYKDAFTNLTEYNEIKDSIYSINKARLTSEAEARFYIDEKNRRIAIMSQQQADNENQLKRNKLVFYLAFALGAILLLFTISLYRNNKNRSKSNALLKKKNIELRKANNAKAQFLSTVTHELRTPLYAVTGLTDILLDKSPTNEQKEHLKSLKFSGDYLLNFINDILHINKIEANKVEVEKTPFNVKKLVNSIIFAFNNSKKNNGNDIIFEFDDDNPEMLLGDSVKVSQVLFNLIGNAIKFTEKGHIWIRIINNGDNKSGLVNYRFEIEDTGIGISNEKLEEIFESFSQGSIQINRKYGGTGLGLTIVRNLLKLLGSSIQLKSKEGKGTLFYFDIMFETTDEPEQKYVEQADRNIDQLLQFKKVLIVEDIKINQMITQKILEKKHLVSDIIDNGEDAVDMVKKGNYDLILMDIHMPGISGIEATKRIRKFDEDTPIIALTAITIDDKTVDFQKAGFDDILSKPFKANDLFNKISTLIVKKPLKSGF